MGIKRSKYQIRDVPYRGYQTDSTTAILVAGAKSIPHINDMNGLFHLKNTHPIWKILEFQPKSFF